VDGTQAKNALEKYLGIVRAVRERGVLPDMTITPSASSPPPATPLARYGWARAARILILLASLILAALVVTTFRWVGPHLQATVYYSGLGGKVSWTDAGDIWRGGGSTRMSFRQRGTAATALADDDLRNIAKLHHLRHLDLSYAVSVTDAGLAHLEGLADLRELYLSRLADHSLDSLVNRNTTGAVITRFGPEITDAGLAHLRPLRRLAALYLNGSRVGDAGLAYLAYLKDLATLDLSETRVTDAGLQRLADLSALEDLSLRDTRISDAGLRTLGTMTRLKALDITGAVVTAEGVDRLRRDLPATTIISSFDAPLSQ
jgi:Leucine Rich repeat